MRMDDKTPEKSEDLVLFVEELKRQWMATIDSLVDPLMIVNDDFTIAKANKSMAVMGGESDIKSILGKRCYRVFAGRESPCEGCSMISAVRERKAHSYSLENIRDGLYFEVSSQPIISSEDKLDGIVQIYRDRTEARKFQHTLVQNEKLASIGLLAGGVAHEINNPLGGILIFSQMLLREMDKASPHYQDVVEIEAATQRCKAIVENLLEFARQQPGADGGIADEEFDLSDVAKTALRLGKVDQNAKAIEFVESWEAGGHTVLGNRTKMVQVFLNLIQNALHAMPDGGNLTIGSQVEEIDGQRFVTVLVEDTGVGIEGKAIKRIFDPFYTTKDPGEGTGLGLAICYGIVQDHKGTIEVSSTVNVGTKFTVRIPISAESNQQVS